MAKVTLTCSACDHADELEVDNAHASEPEKHCALRCTNCNALTFFGVLIPRVVIEPSSVSGHDVVRIRTQHPFTKRELSDTILDPQTGLAVGLNIMSVIKVTL